MVGRMTIISAQDKAKLADFILSLAKRGFPMRKIERLKGSISICKGKWP